MSFIADKILSQTESGLAGEYIAAASVVARGWRVAMAQQDAVDLVAWHPKTSEILRIQVKSCQSSRQDSDSKKRLRVMFHTGIGGSKRQPTKDDYDILACVAAEQRTVWFLPVTEIEFRKYTKRTAFFDDPIIERQSWAHALDVLGVFDGR